MAELPSKGVAARGEEKKALKKSQGVRDVEDKLGNIEAALNASNIDDALEALTLTSGGGKSGNVVIDRHPERRQKAALATFEERRLPEIQKEFPGLRLQQYKGMMFKEFQKVMDFILNFIITGLTLDA
jgi:Coiled-coil domain-containing protein 124 /Oxs1